MKNGNSRANHPATVNKHERIKDFKGNIMIEAYKTNKFMRETFLRVNDIIHAEIWDTEEGYQVALCSGDNVGFPESPEFYTVGQCYKWVAEFCPELNIKE